MLYCAEDYRRDYPNEDQVFPWRNEFARDYGRVVHSPSFRRLQGKTQVFPGHESDFSRNRLTHSLEVAQIAEGIADRLNHTCDELKGNHINSRLCATASLMHDLGHPPFGHNGERALDHEMQQHGGFEGNAQTLRIVAKLEKKIRGADGNSHGLGLCYRTLASILKYDREIPRARRPGQKLVKGYYESEQELIRNAKLAVTGTSNLNGVNFKTIECYIMDIADDIAYSTYDLEDSLKAGFLSPASILTSSSRLLDSVATKVSSEIGGGSYTVSRLFEVLTDVFAPQTKSENDLFASPAPMRDDQLVEFGRLYRTFDSVANNSHYRTKLSSELVRKSINSCQLNYNVKFPMLSKVNLSDEARERVEVLKQYTYLATINSARVRVPEYRGAEVVTQIFKALSGDRGELLMPDDVREQYEAAKGDLDIQMRTVCDFVAGMTDRYAVEFYGRLHSDSAQSMYKPL